MAYTPAEIARESQLVGIEIGVPRVNTKKALKALRFVAVRRSSAVEIVDKEELPRRINKPDAVGGQEIHQAVAPLASQLDDKSHTDDSSDGTMKEGYKNILGLRKVQTGFARAFEPNKS